MWITYVPLVEHSTSPWVQNKVCGKTKNSCLQSLGLNAMYWRGSCSLCSINTAILCITAIPGDHDPDDGTPTHALSVSLLLPNASIPHGSFDLNTNCKTPVFGVDSLIPPGLDSARYLNVTSNFRHRHPLSTQLLSEPMAHVNSYRTFSVFRCGGWRGSFGFSSEGEGVKGGHSTTHKGTAPPNSDPPGTSLNLLVRL